jgi:hypothetical protein
MKKHIEVFNRHEFKYIICTELADNLADFLSDKMILDEHNKNGETYEIHNLYLDTPDHFLIRNSLDKPTYKEKLRLRSYSDFNKIDDDEKIFFEIKKKYDGVVNKRRTKITFHDAKEFIKTATPPKPKKYHNDQVIKELAHALKQYKVTPMVQISYNRMAFFSENSDLRLTIDADVIATPFNSKKKTVLLEPNKRLLEIKSGLGLPIWLVNYLTENNITRMGFSKYGKYHVYELNNKRKKEVTICSTNLSTH